MAEQNGTATITTDAGGSSAPGGAGDAANGSTSAGTGSGGAGEFRPPATQEEFDQRIGPRLARERARVEAEHADLRSKAEQFDKLQQEQMTELERERAARGTAEDDAKTARAEVAELKLERAIFAAAAGKQIIDPEAALAMIDRQAIDYDQHGRPTNIDSLLDDLVKAKPYLVGTNGRGPAPLPGGAAPTTQSGGSMDDWLRSQAQSKGRV